MFKRLLNIPLETEHSFFLFGPRGTGKTSWIRSRLPHALYIDLLNYSTYGVLAAYPNRLEEMIPKDFKELIVLDEVQRIPELLNEVHRLIEHKKLRFLLTGSSARSLRRKGVNLLAGRALLYYMHPLTIQEMGDEFNLNKALLYGLLPSAVTSEIPQSYLESYVHAYIREEVLQEGLTRNAGEFARFLETASFSQGQPVNYSKIGRELFISRQTVTEYFNILEDLLIGIRISPFTKRAKRNVITHQKFYFFDTGVYRHLRPKGLADTPEELDGAGLETLFLQSIRAINDYYNLEYDIYFWQPTKDVEVDFVLYGPHGFHAFEIKRSKNASCSSFKGLNAFKKDYPEAQLHFVHLGWHKTYHDTITAYPFVEALKELPTLLAKKT